MKRKITVLCLIGCMFSTVEGQVSTASEYYQKGNKAMTQQSFSVAIEEYQKAIEIDSTHTQSYLNMGVAYSSLGKNDTALLIFKKVVKINPEISATYVNMGVAYNALGEYKLAIDNLQKAARMGNKSAQDRLKKYGYSW